MLHDNVDDIEKIIAGGESLRVEFKGRLSSKQERAICKEIAALATAQGGLLLIGVNDDKTIVGVDEPQAIITKIEGWVPSWVFPVPEINCSIRQVGHLEIIAVEVDKVKSFSPLYTYNKIPYGRINTKSYPLTISQIADILREITLEQTISEIQTGLLEVRSRAAAIQAAPAIGVHGQGDLATRNYAEVSAQILSDMLVSPDLQAMRSMIAVAQSTAAIAMHSPAPAITAQGDLATMNYDKLYSRIMADLESSALVKHLQAGIATAAVTASIARDTPSPSIVGQGELATISFEELVQRLLADHRIGSKLSAAMSLANSAQSIAYQAIRELTASK